MLKDKIIDLKRQLIEDAALVEDMITKSILGLMEKRADLLREVMTIQEEKVNAFDLSIDESCVQLIAQFEPVARDLRTVIMIIKMNKDLERIADHAVNICESSLYLLANPVLASYDDLQLMGDNASRMLKDSINAFVNEDARLAQSVRERDNIVDDAGEKILKELTVIMGAKKDSVARGLQLMRISQNLERIADLATNIAEEVIYIVEGRDVKHGHSENP